MSTPVNVLDPRNRQGLSISAEGAAAVVEHPHPPRFEAISRYPFGQYMTDTGESGGSKDMNVDGSVTAQDFYVESIAEEDIFIKSINFLVSDGGTVTLDKFGSLAALTNGLSIIYFTKDLGERTLISGINTNLLLNRICGSGAQEIGSGTDSFRADTSGGGSSDTYLPVMNFEELFGFRFGIRLNRGTQDKIIIRVNDDLSALTAMDALILGSTLP